MSQWTPVAVAPKVDAVRKALVELIQGRFRTFGGGRLSTTNPLANALADEPANFAAGVDVRQVVDFVLDNYGQAAKLVDALGGIR